MSDLTERLQLAIQKYADYNMANFADARLLQDSLAEIQ